MKNLLLMILSLTILEANATLTITNSLGEARGNGELIIRDMIVASGTEIETSSIGKILISDSFGNRITVLNSTNAIIYEGKKSIGVKLLNGSIYTDTQRGFQIVTEKTLLKLSSGEMLFSYNSERQTTLIVAFKGRPLIRKSIANDQDADKKNYFELKEMGAHVLDRVNVPTSDNLSDSQVAFLRKNLNQIGQADMGFTIQRGDNVVDVKNHGIYSGEVLENDRVLREELSVEDVLIKPNDEWTNMFNMGIVKAVEFYSVISETKEVRSQTDGLGFKAGYNFSNNYESIDFDIAMVNANSQITECIGCLKSNLDKTSTNSLLGTQLEYSKLINKTSLWGARLSGEQGIFYTLAGTPTTKNVFKGMGNYGYLVNQDLTFGVSAGIGKLDDLATGFSGEAETNYKFTLQGERLKGFFKVIYERYEGSNVIYKSERFHLGIQFEF